MPLKELDFFSIQFQESDWVTCSILAMSGWQCCLS